MKGENKMAGEKSHMGTAEGGRGVGSPGQGRVAGGQRRVGSALLRGEDRLHEGVEAGGVHLRRHGAAGDEGAAGIGAPQGPL